MFQAIESATFQTTTKMTTTLKLSLNSESTESDDSTPQQDDPEKELSLPVKVYNKKNYNKNIAIESDILFKKFYGVLIANPILRCS